MRSWMGGGGRGTRHGRRQDKAAPSGSGSGSGTDTGAGADAAGAGAGAALGVGRGKRAVRLAAEEGWEDPSGGWESPEALVARIEAEAESGALYAGKEAEQVRPAPVEAPARSCGNCGRTGAASLLLCSRCRGEYFCGAKCQRAYWPFHRAECVRNDFADAVADAEPAFARFLRKHGKQAVVRDENVLEIAGPGGGVSKIRWGDASGVATLEDRRRLEGKLPLLGDAEREKTLRLAGPPSSAAALLALGDAAGARARAWAACCPADSPRALSCARAACNGTRVLGDAVKWRQVGGWIEVYVKVTDPTTAHVHVDILPKNLRVQVDGATVLSGELWAPIRSGESTWSFERDVGILEVHLAKQPYLRATVATTTAPSADAEPAEPVRDMWNWPELLVRPAAGGEGEEADAASRSPRP